MKFKRIFVGKGDCKLWSTYEPDDGSGKKKKDVFTQLFDRWNDTAYLHSFFTTNLLLLADPYWQGISVDQAIDKVLDESSYFEMLLKNIETKHPSYTHLTLGDYFINFDKNGYELDANRLYHKKAKLYPKASMLRLYAGEWDGAFIVTGGIIKLTNQLDPTIAAQERAKINRVLQYLKSEQVFTREGLDEL